jgi:4-hydroxy-3-methylbut-2-enyl diphosphate reductase
LAELSQRLGTPAYMVDAPSELQAAWLEGHARVGITAGASAPEILVQGVIDKLRALGAVSVQTMSGVEESVQFPLPKGLRLN